MAQPHDVCDFALEHLSSRAWPQGQDLQDGRVAPSMTLSCWTEHTLNMAEGSTPASLITYC